MGSSASTKSRQEGSTQTATKNPTIKVHVPNAKKKKSQQSEILSSMTEHPHSKEITDTESDDDFLPSKKSSSDFDDDAFEKFCGEIDSVLVGHSSMVEASQRKSSVSSSVYSGAGRAEMPQALLRRDNDFPSERRLSGTLQQQGSFPLHQQEHGHHTHESRQVHPNQRKQSHHQQDQTNHENFSYRAAHQGPSLPPPLVKKSLNPASNWKMPEELAQREQLLRNRFDDTWYADETAYVGGRNLLQGGSREGSLVKMNRNSSLVASQDGGSNRESKQKDVQSQEREGFEFSKFKAVNKKSNSKKIDKLLPATYKGYNTNLTRQGTLPSLHGGSLTSDHSSTSTPARSSSGKHLVYNPSEEDLIAYIEKEFS